MGVRNCEEIGRNARLIIERLLANDRFVNLLYYTEPNPFDQPNLTNEQKRQLVYNKYLLFVPRIDHKETAHSIVSMRVVNGLTNSQNNEFRNIHIGFEIFVPLSEWVIKDENLRPFAIMGEIQKSLNNKTIDGMGKMIGGDFNLNFVTEELSCYEQSFEIITYD